MIGKSLQWLVSEINKALECRKDHLRRRKPGAVAPNEPKVHYIKMLDRPKCQPDKIFTARHKFNTILDDVIKGKKNQYTIEPQGLAHDTRNFLYNNQLSMCGQKLFWMDIDWQIESFDYSRQQNNSISSAQPSTVHLYPNETSHPIKHHSYQYQTAYHDHQEARCHKIAHVCPNRAKRC